MFSLLDANFLAHAFKGAKGDARSSGLTLKYAEKAGLLERDIAALSINQPVELRDSDIGPADALVEGVCPDLLTRDERIEPSELCDVVDLGGDATALSIDQFGRFKYLASKGRGKDVTPKE
jgi:hypothetical protein